MTLLPSPKFKKKTDNQSLDTKCELRRRVVKETQMEPLRVLDLFAGEGNIWRELRKPQRKPEDPEPLEVDIYVPVDAVAKQEGMIKAKVNRRLVASLNGDDDIQSFKGTGLSRFNTIDIDCYGDPWEIWEAVLFRIKQPTVVFATRGVVTYGAGRMPIAEHAKRVMGIPRSWNVPGKAELLAKGDEYCLKQHCPTAKIERAYWIRNTRVTYYAMYVVPRD